MILDLQNVYCQAQVVTATAASTNYIDHGPLASGNTGRDFGVGENLFLVVACVVAMTDAGSDSTNTVSLETDDNTSFSSVATSFSLPVFAALSAAGTVRTRRISKGDLNERYSQLRHTIANGNLSTGSFTGFLTHDIDAYTAYNDAVTIS